ncbi:hypothetical protein CC79DRAFT_156263 [Sarocladium strictum]
MGQRISVEYCALEYGVLPNCTATATWSGEHEKGDVPTEPDVAGVGVVYSFIAVTGFAALVSVVMLLWNAYLAVRYRSSKSGSKHARLELVSRKFDVAAVCDRLVTACSDQQIVVGSAYLWAVHNGIGCALSFYHLIIVSNMIVLSCATHLLCLVSARRYYTNPYIATIRIVVIFVIIGFAGKLMEGGYTTSEAKINGFPQTPEEEAAFFLAAPCFMKSPRIFDLGLSKEEFLAKQRDADDTATLYLGWRMYLLVVCYSTVAVFVTWMRELFRPPPLEQGRSPWGLRKIVHDWKDMRSFVERRSRILTILDWAFRAIGVGVAIGAIVVSADFIVQDRTWAQKSGWMTAGENGRLDEGDADSLGQTLPIFSCVLVFFVLVDESFNELKRWKMSRRGRAEKIARQVGGSGTETNFSDGIGRSSHEDVELQRRGHRPGPYS